MIFDVGQAKQERKVNNYGAARSLFSSKWISPLSLRNGSSRGVKAAIHVSTTSRDGVINTAPLNLAILLNLSYCFLIFMIANV